MNKVYKLPPCSIYDVPAMETWLSDMSRTGLHLKKAGRRYLIFVKGEALDTCYRMEPVTDSCQIPDEEILELYAQAGWEFAAALQKSFLIWHSICPNADEPHSDPLVHSTAYEHLLNRLKKNAVCAALLPAVIFAMSACAMLLSSQPVTVFLVSSPMLLVIIADAALGVQAVRQALELHSLKRSLSNGLPAAHKKDYHTHMHLYRILRFCTSLLVLVILALPAASFFLNWEKTISDIDMKLPYLPLDVIEEGQEGFSWHKDQNMRGGVDTYNRAAYTWSLLVPVHYDIYQQGEVQNVYKNDETIGIAPSAYTEYFQLILPAFTVPLYRERVRCYIHADTNPVVTELSHPAFDHVTIAKSEGFIQLFACRGRQMIHIRYWGDADLTDKLDMLADALD